MVQEVRMVGTSGEGGRVLIGRGIIWGVQCAKALFSGG